MQPLRVKFISKVITNLESRRLKCLLSMTKRQLKITSHIFTIYQNYKKTDFAK